MTLELALNDDDHLVDQGVPDEPVLTGRGLPLASLHELGATDAHVATVLYKDAV